MDMDDQKGLPCISRTLKVNVAVLELFVEHVDIHKHLDVLVWNNDRYEEPNLHLPDLQDIKLIGCSP